MLNVMSTMDFFCNKAFQRCPTLFGAHEWVKVSSELAQDRRAWSASVRDVVNAIGDAGSTRPG